MDYLVLTILVLLNVCWLVLVLFAMPGNWLIVISTGLFAWWRWDEGYFSVYTLVAIVILAILGEIIEFLSGMGGAKRAGAGWKSSMGAIAGAILGAIFGTGLIPIPILGTVLGACIGAGLITWSLEVRSGKRRDQSMRAGVGAGIGVLIGTTTKFVIGILIWLIVAVAAFWP